MNNVALLIPVFNRLDYTKSCLNELKHHENTRFFKENTVYIIVIDDGSTDGTADWITTHFPKVIIVQGTGDLWWSGSMNLGINHALNNLNCEFVFFWENDIIPDTGYFDNLQHILENWEEGTIVCSKIVYRIRPDIIFAMGGIFNFNTGKKKLIGRGEKDSAKYNKIIEADWFCGQGILFHKSVFEKVGYFNEKDFPQYHGDSDFALRAKKAGFKNLVYPELRLLNDTATTGISHISNKTFKQFFQSFISIRSNTNLLKDIKFYRHHTTNIFAFRYLLYTYFLYTAGFIKWKFLGLFGINRKNEELY